MIEAYPTLRSQITNAAVINPEITRSLRVAALRYDDDFLLDRWVQEEGHLPKVWAMAERSAKIIGVDEVCDLMINEEIGTINRPLATLTKKITGAN